MMCDHWCPWPSYRSGSQIHCD